MLKTKVFKKIFAKLKLFLFLLRLLISNKNKIRYLIFDSMILKKFLTDDNWIEILDKHPENKQNQ